MPILENKKMRPIRWVYDLLREKFPTRKKALTPPSVGMFDSPTACVQVNLEWSSHVIGALESLSQMDSWRGSDATQFQALQEVEKLFNALAVESDCPESDMPTLLRQNPANACLLEYSINNGATWSLAFDYSLCIGETVQNTIENTINQGDSYNFYKDGSNYIYLLRKEYKTTFNLTINNMYPSLVVPTGEEPTTFNEDALCYLCNLFVDSTSAMFVKAIDEKNNNVGANQSTLFLAIMGIVVTVIGVIATGGIGLLWGAGFFTSLTAAGAFTGWLTSIAVAISNLVLNGDELAYDYAYTAFNNATARRLIACCMYNNLVGLPSQAEFEASLSGCDFDAESDEEKVRSALNDVIIEGGLEVYLTFIDMYAGIGQGLENGDIEPVDCLCDEWCYLFDFTTSSGGEFVSAYLEGGYEVSAQYVGGLGWSSVDVTHPNGLQRVRKAGIDFRFSQKTYIKTMEFTFDYLRGEVDDGGYFGRRETFVNGLDNSVLTNNTSNLSAMAVFNGDNNKRLYTYNRDMTLSSGRFQYWSDVDYIPPQETLKGKVLIKSILVCGLGRCPFGAPNYFPE